MRVARSLVLACVVAAGCGGSDGASGSHPTDHGPEGAFFANLPSGAAQLATVCARGSHDAVATHFCGATPPSISSISELEHAVGLFDGAAPPAVALTAHSTSLVVREV